jgi:RNA polymerase sigma factor (sigma-70 family)
MMNKRGMNDLLIRIGQGDMLALNWLYELLHRHAVGMILAEIGGLDEADADASYNRAMQKIWSSASSYQSRSSGDVDVTAYAWVRTTILNTARDAARALRKRAAAEQQESDMIVANDDDNQPELSPMEQLMDEELAPNERETNDPADLLLSKLDWTAFLATLDEREMRICTRLADGRTQTEIAAELGISAARLSQIISGLRQRASGYVNA